MFRVHAIFSLLFCSSFIFPQMPRLFCRTPGWRKAENMLWAISLRPKRREEKLSARVDDFLSWMEDSYAGRWIGHSYLYHPPISHSFIMAPTSKLGTLRSPSIRTPYGCNLHVSKEASWDGNYRLIGSWVWSRDGGNHSFFTHYIIAALTSAAVLKTTTQGIQRLQGIMTKSKHSQCKENIHITRSFSSYTFVRMDPGNPLLPVDGAHHAGKRWYRIHDP